MKKAFLFLLLTFCPSFALAQSTTVSGQVTDSAGQSWNNGTYSFQFVPNPNFPNSPYNWTGGAFNPFAQISGSLSATGSYSGASVPDNSTLTPSGSKWRLQVCSGTTPASCFSQIQTITGPTATVNVTPPPPIVPPGSGNSVYATTEVSGANVGSQIYTIGIGLQTCSTVVSGSCTTWVSIGGAARVPVTCASSVTLPYTSGASETNFSIPLSCNVTSSSVTGSFGTGAEISILLQNSGGNTFSFPPTFDSTTLPTVQSAASSKTSATWVFCGPVGDLACPSNTWANKDVGPSGTGLFQDPVAGFYVTTLGNAVPGFTVYPFSASQTADLFIGCNSVFSAGLACPIANRVFRVQSNGNVIFTGNQWQIGTTGQTGSASLLQLFGGTSPTAGSATEGGDNALANPTFIYYDPTVSGVACLNTGAQSGACGAQNRITTGTAQVILGADYTNSTTTASTVVSFVLPATPVARDYKYTCDFLWESTAATLTGPQFGVNLSVAPTQLTASNAVENTSAGAMVTGYISNTTTGHQNVGVGTAAGVTTTNYWARMWGTIEGASTSGSTFIIDAAALSNTTSTVNIRRGGGCELHVSQ